MKPSLLDIDPRPCFFCISRKATGIYGLSPPAKWPEPMEPDAVLAECDVCAELPVKDKAGVVMMYVNNLRTIERNKAIAKAAADERKRRLKKQQRLLKGVEPGGSIGIVYFVSAGDSVKIGFTRDLKNRLSYLSIASPVPLKVLGIMKGKSCLEAKLHERFASVRLRGEWFQASPDLLDFIRENAKPWEGGGA